MQPIAFSIGTLTIHWYGVLVAIGFLLGLWTASRRGMLAGLTQETVMDLGPWLIVGAVVGARTLYVGMFWGQEFAGQPFWNVFKVWQGGLVYYGGLIGSSLACILYALIKKAPLWKLADVMAPSVALGQMFGRIGCLMNGCCYGRPANMACAITFPAGHDTHARNQAATPVHPTQIYEAVLTLLLYLTLAWLFRRKHRQGHIFAFYLIGYGICRAIVELFRGDYPPNQLLNGWVTPAHVVSAIVLTIGLGLWAFLRVNQPIVGPEQTPAQQAPGTV